MCVPYTFHNKTMASYFRALTLRGLNKGKINIESPSDVDGLLFEYRIGLKTASLQSTTEVRTDY